MQEILKTLALAAAVTTTMASATMADPVYMIAQIQIDDHEKYFDEYGAGVVPIIVSAGGKILVATPTVENLEGEWAGNWTVVVEFPSEEAALTDWYNSEAYVEVHKLRLATTSVNNLVVAPAFVPPAQ
ncbi:MAG: DUF1330 domain-containing protein [Gammaproteobacteria bacterium]|nr:DUF1330 domain-containing protein [Gammaproteobacteria bacterium]